MKQHIKINGKTLHVETPFRSHKEVQLAIIRELIAYAHAFIIKGCLESTNALTPHLTICSVIDLE